MLLSEAPFYDSLKPYSTRRIYAIEYKNDRAEAEEEKSEPRKETQETDVEDVDPGLRSPCRQGMMPV